MTSTTTTMADTGATPSPPPLDAVFDRKLEAERARWLRRRFLWFCGVTGALGLLMAVPLVIASQVGDGTGAAGEAAAATFPYPLLWVHGVELLVSTLLVVGSFLYVLRRPPARAGMLHLAEAVTAGVGAISFAAEWLGRTLVGRFDVSDWVGTATGTILLTHLPACLFLPWTPRECLRPGLLLLAMNALVLAVQTPRAGGDTAYAVGAIALTPLLLAPGLFVCWWRNSRFRRRFRLLFESEAYRKLHGELASARRIHESCLPAPLLDGPVCLQYAYAPMQQIGGDLLFVPPACAAAADGRVSVVVLDVTGHGVAAALTVNRLVGELERVFGESADASPRDVLCSLNRYVHLTLARHGVFVTALCIRADAQRGVLEWASGGHPTAFLCRADGRFEDLESTGFLLGAVDGAEYTPEQIERPFQPGDAVIAYTDGATEARDAAGAALRTAGLRRLVATIGAGGTPPAAWPGAVMRRVVSHNDDGPEDDILVVTLYRPVSAPRRETVGRQAPAVQAKSVTVAAGRA